MSRENSLYKHKYRELSRAIEDIRQEIARYEADCRLAGGSDECEECNNNVFGSIYRIIDRHIGKESE